MCFERAPRRAPIFWNRYVPCATLGLVIVHRAHHARRIARGDAVWRHVFGNHAARADQAVRADGDSGQQHRANAYLAIVPDFYGVKAGQALVFLLERPVQVVIDEGHVVTDADAMADADEPGLAAEVGGVNAAAVADAHAHSPQNAGPRSLRPIAQAKLAHQPNGLLK